MINEDSKVISIKDISKKIKNKLIPSGWYDVLRIYLESAEFDNIIKQLQKKVEENNQRFCPSIGKAFRCLEDNSYDSIKCVILLDYTENRIEYAAEEPLSRRTLSDNEALTYLLRSMELCPTGTHYWDSRRVMILPTALTSRLNGKAHKAIWAPFIIRVIEALNKKYKKIPWILAGENTYEYYYDIASPNIKKVPINRKIQPVGCAQWINEVLVDIGKEPVSW